MLAGSVVRTAGPPPNCFTGGDGGGGSETSRLKPSALPLLFAAEWRAAPAAPSPPGPPLAGPAPVAAAAAADAFEASTGAPSSGTGVRSHCLCGGRV